MSSKAGRHAVWRITQKLLLAQARSRNKHEIGKPDHALKNGWTAPATTGENPVA